MKEKLIKGKDFLVRNKMVFVALFVGFGGGAAMSAGSKAALKKELADTEALLDLCQVEGVDVYDPEGKLTKKVLDRLETHVMYVSGHHEDVGRIHADIKADVERLEEQPDE